MLIRRFPCWVIEVSFFFSFWMLWGSCEGGVWWWSPLPPFAMTLAVGRCTYNPSGFVPLLCCLFFPANALVSRDVHLVWIHTPTRCVVFCFLFWGCSFRAISQSPIGCLDRALPAALRGARALWSRPFEKDLPVIRSLCALPRSALCCCCMRWTPKTR